MKFGEKLFQTKLLSRLSHKACRLLSFPVLLRKFTILAGKRGSRRHSTTSEFSENVEVAETSYQMLKVLLFCGRDRERVQPPSRKVTVLTFLVKNGKMKLSGESTF